MTQNTNAMQDGELLSHLRFNLDVGVPALEDCYAYGYEAGQEGAAVEANPYKTNVQEAEQWTQGWEDGFFRREPLYDLDLSDKTPAAKGVSTHGLFGPKGGTRESEARDELDLSPKGPK